MTRAAPRRKGVAARNLSEAIPLTPSELDLRLRVAEAITREAGQVAARYYARRDALTIDRKGAQDLVSEADRACEDLIVAGLSGAFPDDGLLGEERGLRKAGEGPVWIIDPIDGTHNFLTGIPFWCLSVGLAIGGEAVLGVIYHPATGELFTAKKGGGAFVNGVPMRVTGESDLTRARVGLGFSFRRPVADHLRTVGNLLGAGCEYTRLGSGALGLAYVAAGRLDGFWEHHINSWDVAAGLALVREAGGWTSDFFAGEGLMKGNSVLAATPALVEPLKPLLAAPSS